MQFYEDVKEYYFSENPITDAEERSLIVRRQIDAAKDMFKTSFAPEKTVAGTAAKFGAFALFLAAVGLVIYFSTTKNVGGILYTFGGMFVLFGLFMLIPAKEKPKDIPGRAKMPRGIGCAVGILIGLAVVIPTAIAPTVGYSKAFMISAAATFTLGGLFFIFYIIYGIIRQKNAEVQTISGRCIGYIKMVDGGGANIDNHHQTLTITATPVFEYYINGQSYKAFQEDDMRTGKMKIAVGETVELNVDPNDPYAVFYHKNTAGRIIAVVLALLALGAGIFLFCYLPNVNDDNGFVVNTSGGQVRLAQAKFDDKTIESHLNTKDFTIEYATVTSIYQYEDRWLIDLSNGNTRPISEADKDRYYEGVGVYVVLPADGNSGLLFIADEWVYNGEHTVAGLNEG